MPFAASRFSKERKSESLDVCFSEERLKVSERGLYLRSDGQTRGWFYTLPSLLGRSRGGGASFKNAISLGHMLDAEGQKMSKSKGNVVDH